MSGFQHPARHRVAVLVRDGVLPMELGIVHRLFGHARSPEGEPLYEVVTCTPVPGRVRADADVSINVENGTSVLAEADTVIVPAANEPDDPQVTGRLGAALTEAFGRIEPGTRIASICTGAFVLAATGMLDGRRATTHWKAADHFRQLYPAVLLDPDVLYTDEGGVLTSAGDAAGIDLCLHLIRSDHGSAIANDVARATVVPPHRAGGQAQFILRPVPEPKDSSTQRARGWALEHLDQLLTLRQLAARESMSARTFTRRFRQEVGCSPQQWLTRQRIDRARHLLEDSAMSVEQIAERAGFGTAASLRQHLRASLGVSPTEYRATFGGTRIPGAGSSPGVQGRCRTHVTPDGAGAAGRCP